jgi:hypothetical protein
LLDTRTPPHRQVLGERQPVVDLHRASRVAHPTNARENTLRADVLIGYSHFFAGSVVKATHPKGVSGDDDFCYSQWSYHF